MRQSLDAAVGISTNTNTGNLRSFARFTVQADDAE